MNDAGGRRTRLFPWVVLVCSLLLSDASAQHTNEALFSRGEHPVRTGTTARGVEGIASADCARCHQEIAREWRSSLHARAWNEPIFRASYAHEPDARCRNCHAPLIAEGAPVPDAFAASEGISCAVCHVRNGVILGSGAGRTDTAPGTRGHTTVARAEFSESAYCGGCHQFDFPERTSRGTSAPSGEAMQNTLREWSSSLAAQRGQTCQDCHLPWSTSASGRRYRSHAFLGLESRSLLDRSVRVAVRVERSSNETIVATTITPHELGHAFPTGDLFRLLELSVWIDGQPLTERVTRFGRTFRATNTHRRTQSEDHRIPAPGAGVPVLSRVSLPQQSSGSVVRWRLEHLRMPTELALSLGVSSAQNRTLITEGSVLIP